MQKMLNVFNLYLLNLGSSSLTAHLGSGMGELNSLGFFVTY